MSNSKNLKTIVIGGTGKVGEELITTIKKVGYRIDE